MNNNSIFIPFGIDCSIANYLRKEGKRNQAFPFDWSVTPTSSAIDLIQNDFSDFLDFNNLLFLPPVKRLLYKENGIDLKVSDEIITPVICKKYHILFPHDFPINALQDLPSVKKKYENRINRLKQYLNDSKKIIFVYNQKKINSWQSNQFLISNLNFPQDSLSELKLNFKLLKKTYYNIHFISLSSLQLYSNPLLFFQKFLNRFFPIRKPIIKNNYL
jgi:hypothetical protein